MRREPLIVRVPTALSLVIHQVRDERRRRGGPRVESCDRVGPISGCYCHICSRLRERRGMWTPCSPFTRPRGVKR